MDSSMPLGRIFSYDHRRQAWLVKDRLPDLAPKEPAQIDGSRKFWVSRRARLDQLSTGTCVAHGHTHAIINGPVRNVLGMHPYEFYRKIVLRDVWSENDFEASAPDDQLQFGTSVEAGALVARDLGFYREFLWAEDADTALKWVTSQGGMVGGFNWYEGMSGTDKNGFVHPEGQIRGGHCVWCFGGDEGNGDTWWLNSWGPWGRRGEGTFKMSYETLDRLIREDGELCMPTEVKRAA